MEDIGYLFAVLIWACIAVLALMLARWIGVRHSERRNPKPIVIAAKTAPNPFMAPTPAIEVRNVISNIRFPINR